VVHIVLLAGLGTRLTGLAGKEARDRLLSSVSTFKLGAYFSAVCSGLLALKMRFFVVPLHGFSVSTAVL